MIPATIHNMPAMACVSAMQKSIRRGLEREAMEFAIELMHTSKAFHSMVCKRLEIISHEDIGLTGPGVLDRPAKPNDDSLLRRSDLSAVAQ